MSRRTFGDEVAEHSHTVTLEQYRLETFADADKIRAEMDARCTDLEAHLYGECSHYDQD